jgi:regulator of chromosome condensation
MEKIKAVACAPYHTLILTTFGSVFSCGDGSDGQLGHGSLEAHHDFRRIDSFTLNIKDSIDIEQISAGGDRFGCHSAAIDKNGALYTWGNAKLCGHHLETNSNKPSGPLTCPRHVSEFQVSNSIFIITQQLTIQSILPPNNSKSSY